MVLGFELDRLPESPQSLYNDGQQEIVRQAPGFTYPIKIVAVVKKEMITIITAYPLKKGLVK